MPPYAPPIPTTDMIDDLVGEGAIVVFLLESAHTDEIKHGYPACGDAGRNMTHAILGRTDVPLTLLIRHPQIATLLDIPNVSHIAVMNVSRRPLQEKAYKDHLLPLPADMKELQSVKKTFEKKRYYKKKDLGIPKEEKAQQQLYTDFFDRFHPRRAQFKLVIPCGYFAHYFLSWYLEKNPDPPFAILEGLQHPAKAGKDWGKLKPTDRELQMLRRLVSPESVFELAQNLDDR